MPSSEDCFLFRLSEDLVWSLEHPLVASRDQDSAGVGGAGWGGGIAREGQPAVVRPTAGWEGFPSVDPSIGSEAERL